MTAADAGPDRPAALRATCWGTRGSIPSPGPGTVRRGGNTSCLEVLAEGGRTLVFDAGTGLRALGREQCERPGGLEADLFVSHYHWDHIQGFPLWLPLHDPAARIRVHGPRQGDVPVQAALAGQMSPLYWPLSLDELPARLAFHEVGGAPWSDGWVEVAAYRLRHPGVTYGYRVRAGGATLAYVPDNEISDGGDAWYAGLVAFVRGADLLFHDAMFTEAEYARRRGWGHSTFAQALRLAEDAGVARLALFHHSPDRGDDELDRIAGELAGELERRGSPLVLSVATEGEEIALAGRPR